jgi:spermidine synthase
MALEVVWTRALVFYIHNSTYAFSAILAIYLLGLAVGAAAGGRLSSGAGAARWLGWTLAGIVFSTLLAIALYRNLPTVVKPLLGETLAPALAGLPDRSFWIVRNWVSALASIFLQAGVVLFLPAFFFGMVFPLAIRLIQNQGDDTSSLVGKFYAMNTLGSVAGTVLGSFLLIPLLGTRGALLLLACLTAPLAFLAIGRTIPAAKLRFGTLGALGAAMLGAALLAAPSGFYRNMFAKRFGPVLWFSEGVAETVAICEHKDRSAWIHYSDGRGASGTTSFRGGWLYAHVPLLLHPDPHSALVICFGTGNTLGAASLHPLARVDGVELSSEVIKASAFFKESNHDVAHNPNVHLTVEDGRNYLLRTTARYDVITEEPPLIHTAGVVNLYSRDFYQLCARRLSDNGIMAVWLATWELEDRDVRMLVRAFVEAFPYASAWDSQHLGEWVLIGSKQPLAVDPARLAQRMSEPRLAQDLAKIGIRSPADLLALYLKGGEFLKTYSQAVPPVTDDRSVVDYTIPRQARSNFGLGEWLTGGLNLSGVGPSGLVSELRVREFDSIYTHREPVDSLLLPATTPGDRDSLLQEIGARRLAAEIQSGRKLTWNLMATASDYTELRRPEKSLEILDWGIGIVGPVPSADLLANKAKLLFAQGRSADAREALSRALALDPTHAQALKLAAEFHP